MMRKFNEIVKLHEMLLEAGIEHDWVDRNPPGYPKTIIGEQHIDFGW